MIYFLIFILFVGVVIHFWHLSYLTARFQGLVSESSKRMIELHSDIVRDIKQLRNL